MSEPTNPQPSERFLIATADWESDRPSLRAIREEVFVDEQKVPRELEWDEDDASCIHLLAYSVAGAPVGTARMKPDGQIGRMAVLKDWRGQGVGSALLLSLIGIAEEHGLNEVFLHAQISALGFYHQHGFIAQGEEYMEAGIPHVNMARFCGDP